MIKKATILFLFLTLVFCVSCTEKAPWDTAALYGVLEEKVDLSHLFELDDGEKLEFCGIKAEEYAQSLIYISQNQLLADEIWLIEAKDAAGLEAAEQEMLNRVDIRSNEAKNYSPAQYEVLQNYKIVKSGLCIALIISPDAAVLSETVEKDR